MKIAYKYSFFTAPVDSLITNTIINSNVNLLEHHLNIFEFGITQYAIGFATYKICKQFTYTPVKIQQLLDKYNLGRFDHIMSSIAVGYMQANAIRAIMFWNSIHSDAMLYTLHMTTHDPSFILPLLVGFSNYLLLRTSNYKGLQTLQHDKNKLKLINLCFMSSLLTVGLPDILVFYMTMAGCQLLRQVIRILMIKRLIQKSQINI